MTVRSFRVAQAIGNFDISIARIEDTLIDSNLTRAEFIYFTLFDLNFYYIFIAMGKINNLLIAIHQLIPDRFHRPVTYARNNWRPLGIYIGLHAIAYAWLSSEALLIWIAANVLMLSVLGIQNYLNQKERYLKPIPVKQVKKEELFFEGGFKKIKPVNIEDIPKRTPSLSTRDKDHSISNSPSIQQLSGMKPSTIEESEVNLKTSIKDKFSDIGKRSFSVSLSRAIRAESSKERDEMRIVYLKEKVVPRQKLLSEQRMKEGKEGRGAEPSELNTNERTGRAIGTTRNDGPSNTFQTPSPGFLGRSRSTPPYTSNFLDGLPIGTQKAPHVSSFNVKSPTGFYRGGGEQTISPIKPQISKEGDKIHNFSMFEEPKLWEELGIGTQRPESRVSPAKLTDEDYINYFKTQIKRLPSLRSYTLSEDKIGPLASKLAGSSVPNPSVKISKLFEKLGRDITSTKKIACKITVIIEVYQYESAKAEGKLLYLSLINQLIDMIVDSATDSKREGPSFINSLSTLAHIVNLKVPGFVDTLFYYLASKNKMLIPENITRKPDMESREYYKKLGYELMIGQAGDPYQSCEDFLKKCSFLYLALMMTDLSQIYQFVMDEPDDQIIGFKKLASSLSKSYRWMYWRFAGLFLKNPVNLMTPTVVIGFLKFSHLMLMRERRAAFQLVRTINMKYMPKLKKFLEELEKEDCYTEAEKAGFKANLIEVGKMLEFFERTGNLPNPFETS